MNEKEQYEAKCNAELSRDMELDKLLQTYELKIKVLSDLKNLLNELTRDYIEEYEREILIVKKGWKEKIK